MLDYFLVLLHHILAQVRLFLLNRHTIRVWRSVKMRGGGNEDMSTLLFFANSFRTKIDREMLNRDAFVHKPSCSDF
jgi:hypothetical protein